MVKDKIKSFLMYRGSPATASIRSKIATVRRPGWPYVPADEGDTLFNFAQRIRGVDALEVGCATGSTAVYILTGQSESGSLTSVDFDHGNKALPELYASGRRFGLIFLDGWKTFDHVWVDVYYCARMLEIGGMIVFDDARMPSVRKCISILEKYYEFKRVDTYAQVGGWRQRLWHILTTRGFLAPYVALQKVIEVEKSPAGKQYNFWARF